MSETKAIRVFYRISDSEIVWYHLVIAPEGMPALFPNTHEEDLAGIPTNCPGGETPLGGLPGDYACIEEHDTQVVNAFLASDNNQIVGGELSVGEPRPEPPPPEPSPVFDPPHGTGVPHRLEYIEQFLRDLYPGG